jgi:glycosyltransferase involved in cell wall biosynthesis
MISVIMSYYNRLPLLKYTLETISNTNVKKSDFEIIIVDDFSNNENNIDYLSNFRGLNIKIIKMSEKRHIKNYCNPCIPFNVGFAAAQGDKILIQNPECCHVGDIIDFCDKNIDDSSYFSFSCYSCDEAELKKLHESNTLIINEKSVMSDGDSGWYNHPIHRPVGYHFTSCITKNNLMKLNGFDETFANGHGWDDNEFLYRIGLLKLDIKLIISPFVIHQFHYNSGPIDGTFNINNNKDLYHLTQKSGIIKVNQNK